jgi:hypothetical protein
VESGRRTNSICLFKKVVHMEKQYPLKDSAEPERAAGVINQVKGVRNGTGKFFVDGNDRKKDLNLSKEVSNSEGLWSWSGDGTGSRNAGIPQKRNVFQNEFRKINLRRSSSIDEIPLKGKQRSKRLPMLVKKYCDKESMG